MSGFRLGSSVTAVAIEVNNGAPDWGNGAIMNLSNRTAVDAERHLMEIIEGSKRASGKVEPSVRSFERNYRLNNLVDFLLKNGWSATSAFSGLGALFLT